MSSFLTFDCFGTLVDWESGILSTIKPYLIAHGHTPTDNEILALYAEEESSAQTGAYIPYRQVLRQVMRGFGFHYQFSHTQDEIESLEKSLPTWPLFPDTQEVLGRLKEKHKLVIISNIDDDLFELTKKKIGVEFDHIITAQQVGAYKPSIKCFRHALGELKAEPKDVLHIAQSLYHDILPAKSLGIKTCWVNRRHGKEGSGATPPIENAPTPDYMVNDLFEACRVIEEAN